MANESETVMSVCAEWRACIESADPSVWSDERIAGLVKTTKAQQLAYLDRIEAAWRREKSDIEADALAVGGARWRWIWTWRAGTSITRGTGSRPGA